MWNTWLLMDTCSDDAFAQGLAEAAKWPIAVLVALIIGW